MGLLFKNNAETTLSSGINNSVTTVPVASAAVFPTPDANNVFFATIEEGNTVEVVKVTGISSNDLTVVRAQDNTSAAAFGAGAKVELRLTAKILETGTSSLTDLDGDTKIQIEESDDEDKIRFDTAGSERVIIDNSGNVGIGTTTINTGTLGTNNKFLEVAAGTASGSGTLVLSRDTSGNNNELGGIRFVNANNADDDGLDADGKFVAAISARSVTSDSNASDDSGADLVFYTKPEAGNYSERVRIDSSGKLGLGTSTPDTDGYSFAEDFVIMAGTSADDGVGITLNSSSRRYGVLAFGDSADTNAGEIWYDHTLNTINLRTAAVHRFSLDSSGNGVFSGNVTAYGSPSDLKLKENIEVIENALDKVKQLKGITYDLKSDGNRLTGLIAQDLEKVLPEAVYTSQTLADGKEGEVAEEYLAIRYGNTVGLLVEAIKEQQEQIEALTAKVKELEDK